MNHAAQKAFAEEVEFFAQAVERFQTGLISDEQFWDLRMPLGIYSQRKAKHYMMRMKLPGGRITPRQLAAVADIGGRFCPDEPIRLTSRQDIQFKGVPEHHLVGVLRALHAAGLTTLEAGGSTIRNIVACPLAGVCPRELQNVLPVAEDLVVRYLGHPLTRHLPRKFKMAVSGCAADCALGDFQDLGMVAVQNDQGAFGYRVVMGGGLGPKPRQGHLLEAWIPEEELPIVIEAVLRLHGRYSDRDSKSRSRIKFLREIFSPEWVMSTYAQEKQWVQLAGADQYRPIGRWSVGLPGAVPGDRALQRVWPQKQPGLCVVPIHAPLGNLTVAQVAALATAVQDMAGVEVRITAGMDLLLLHVPEQQVAGLLAGLQHEGLQMPGQGDDVKACTGSDHCNLGFTPAARLARTLFGRKEDVKIRVCGCHNGCVHSELSDIGLIGEIRRPFKKPVPCYLMVLGGKGCAEGRLGRPVGSIPATRVEQAVDWLLSDYGARTNLQHTFAEWLAQQETEALVARLQPLTVISEAEAEQMSGAGGAQAFEVKTGVNECAGPRKANVRAAFTQAAHERHYRQAFVARQLWQEAMASTRDILRHIGTTLLSDQFPGTISGLTQLAYYAHRRFPRDVALGETLSRLVQRLDELEKGAEPAEFIPFFAEVDLWTLAVADYWTPRDVCLRLRAYLPERSVEAV
ncbi:MAG: nitrite/sulfite reductase [Magnetococcales bacterium]|nr:nitrite/sulfite reductase [Magnetococcales bacterium]